MAGSERESWKAGRSEAAGGPVRGQAGPAASLCPRTLSLSIRHALNTAEPLPRAGQCDRTGTEAHPFPQHALCRVLSLHDGQPEPRSLCHQISTATRVRTADSPAHVPPSLERKACASETERRRGARKHA